MGSYGVICVIYFAKSTQIASNVTKVYLLLGSAIQPSIYSAPMSALRYTTAKQFTKSV